MAKKSTRFALAATASLAVLSMGAATAQADYLHLGDAAVSNDAPAFRLNKWTLEPGCFSPGMHRLHHGIDVDAHIDVTERSKQAHVKVTSGANFSVDQVLVPGKRAGYKVYNTFDTGSINNDADVDPDQTATDLTGPGGADVDKSDIIVCVSDHPDGDQNEPYISDGLPGEVAAINRPIIQPTVSALGVRLGCRARAGRRRHKVGFGYDVQRGLRLATGAARS